MSAHFWFSLACAKNSFTGYKMASIEVSGVSLEIPINRQHARRIRTPHDQGRFGRMVARNNGSNRMVVQVLDDVSLTVRPGQRLGLLGRNGSGKTSLLRVMAGIYEPNRGRVDVQGRINPFLDMSIGFDPESSGLENIFYRGYMLGLNKKVIQAKIDDILEFSEIGDFAHMPVYTYSSGMRLRLALAISTCIEPEILLLDEWVGAGDAGFLEKARDRMMNLVEQSSTLVVASHAKPLLRRLCDTIAVLDRGQVRFIGKPGEAIAFYDSEILQMKPKL